MLEKEIQLLKEISTPAVQEAIASYSSWFFAASLGWIICGIILIYGGYRFIKPWQKAEDKTDPGPAFGMVGIGIAIFVGAMMIFSNVPDLLNTKAMAIHQLLKDIRGK